MDFTPNMRSALDAFLRGNLQKADLLCRKSLGDPGDHSQALMLLGRIAQCVGDEASAHAYLGAAKAHVHHGEVQLAPQPARAVRSGPNDQPRYLLIKSWGFGFWSDMDHVYGALLLADITGRVPIVHWGRNSLFRNADTDNAFESFFQPVSSVRWADINTPGLSYFPPKWSTETLGLEDRQKWSGEGSHFTGLYFLNRPENVAVSDFHIKVNDLMPWIPQDSIYHGMDRNQIYRHLNEKYIRLQPHLAERMNALWHREMADRHWLAVHVRGTDKVYEIGNLDAINGVYERHIDKILSINPALSIFLLTDSHEVVGQFRAKYGDRVSCTDCQRGSGTTGVHLEGHSGTDMGEQVITDAYMASRCDFFLGNGGSNVSTAIRHLKSWPKGTFFLIGQDFLAQVDLSLHNW